MVRIKHAVKTRRRKHRILKRAKGQFGQRSRRYQQAKRSLLHSMAFAYRDRKARTREIRSLWIIRINAACREAGLSYSRFIKGLIKAQVKVDRKMLAELAVNSRETFNQLVSVAQKALASKAT